MLSYQKIAILEIKELIAQVEMKLISEDVAISGIFTSLEKLYRDLAEAEAADKEHAEPTRHGLTRRDEDELFKDIIGDKDFDTGHRH